MKEFISHNGSWETQFREVYDNAMQLYKAGRRDPENLVSPDQAVFLISIGCIAQELYDFVEDWVEMGDPTFDVVLRITAIRREYFLTEQHGHLLIPPMSNDAFPPRDATLGGFSWLPRIIAKAKAKLRGELPPELMYGCGNDRRFLKSIGTDPEDFLRVIWDTGDDEQKVLEYVKAKAKETAGVRRAA